VKHEKTVVVLLTIWAFTFTNIVRAATLSEFMGAYDWPSLFWAAKLGIMGGVLRTICTLAGDGRVVWLVLLEGLRDAIVSLIAGMAMFAAIEVVRSSGLAVSDAQRFGAILVAGVMRKSTFTWMGSIGTEVLSGVRGRLLPRAVDAATPPAPAPKDAP
jgi:hypothetical protein